MQKYKNHVTVQILIYLKPAVAVGFHEKSSTWCLDFFENILKNGAFTAKCHFIQRAFREHITLPKFVILRKH